MSYQWIRGDWCGNVDKAVPRKCLLSILCSVVVILVGVPVPRIASQTVQVTPVNMTTWLARAKPIQRSFDGPIWLRHGDKRALGTNMSETSWELPNACVIVFVGALKDSAAN